MKLKKIIGLITAATLLNTFAFAEFTDIDNFHWGYEAVEKMAQVEILSGYPDGSFKPNKNITLAEYASIFSKFFDIKENTKDNYFVDVEKAHWAKSKIEAIREYIQPQYDSIAESLNDNFAAVEYGIKQDLPITREIVIYSLNSILALDNTNYSEQEAKVLFADYDKILFPEAAMALYKNNIISGEIIDGKVYIQPERYITRAEISSMFAKLLNNGQKIINTEQVETFNQILNQVKVLSKEGNLNQVKNYIYDSNNRLTSIDFNNLVTKDVKTMINKYCDNLKYEIADYGFASYNKAYITLNKTSYNYKSLIGNMNVNSLTKENIESILSKMVKDYKKLKLNETVEVINFIKTNNGWKIVL